MKKAKWAGRLFLTMKDYRKLLEKYRQKHGLSQESLARVLGVTYGSISRWLRGKCLPSVMAQRQIDELLAKDA